MLTRYLCSHWEQKHEAGALNVMKLAFNAIFEAISTTE